MIELDNKLAKIYKERQQELEIMKQDLKIKAECFTENVLKAKVLETTVEVYK